MNGIAFRQDLSAPLQGKVKASGFCPAKESTFPHKRQSDGGKSTAAPLKMQNASDKE
jgi:hypothetical protein